MAKKCPPGKYYCFTDKKCKKIPRGYRIGARGYLARDTKDDDNETKKNGNGSSNGNGNGGNGAGNGNGGSGGNGGGNGGGGMGESIIYEKSNPRIPRKPGQPAKSKKHSDLYTDEDPKGTIHGLGFKDVAKAKASVSKIRNSSRSHAHKIQAAVAMEQRAREMGKTSEAAVYRKYINAMKKKTKRMNEAVNAAQQAAIAINMKKKGKKPKNIKEEESAPNNEQQSRKNQKGKLEPIKDILKGIANNPEKRLRQQMKEKDDVNEGMYNHSDVGLITNAVVELEDGLKTLKTITYDSVDQLMQGIAKRNDISPTLLHNQFKAKHFTIPDNWAIRYRMNKRKGIEEATMTSAQKRKDTMLKKKYDKSDMKKSMQKQYGKEEGKKVYFATIRKQAMSEMNNKEMLDKMGVKLNSKGMPDLEAAANNPEAQKAKNNPEVKDAEKKIEDALQKGMAKIKKEETDKYNVSEEGLRDWFGKSSGTTKSGRKVRGWVQVGGKYDGKPCARQPGQKSTPKCVSSSKRRSMSKKERDSAARRKRAADPNQPQKSGAAKPTNVSTDPKRKMRENYFNRNKVIEEKAAVKMHTSQAKRLRATGVSESMDMDKFLDLIAKKEKRRIGKGGDPNQSPLGKKVGQEMKKQQDKQRKDAGLNPDGTKITEAKDKKGKGSGTKDACYHKVKSRYSVWPSAYASGALVKCRKVGAANWGNKSKNEGFSPMQVAALEAAGMIEIKEGQRCWKGYEKKGTKMMFGKRYNNCVKKKATKEEVELQEVDLPNIPKKPVKMIQGKREGVLPPDQSKIKNKKALPPSDKPKTSPELPKLESYAPVTEGVMELIRAKKEEKKKSKPSVSTYVRKRDAGKEGRKILRKKDQETVNFLEPEETNESKTRLVKNGHTYKVVLTWRGKTYMVQMFVPSVSRPTRLEIEKEVRKLYPDAKVMSFLPKDLEPGEPTVMMGEEKRDEYGDIVGGPKISKKQKAKNLAKNEKDEQHTTTTSEAYSSKPSNLKKKAKLTAALNRLQDLKVKQKMGEETINELSQDTLNQAARVAMAKRDAARGTSDYMKRQKQTEKFTNAAVKKRRELDATKDKLGKTFKGPDADRTPTMEEFVSEDDMKGMSVKSGHKRPTKAGAGMTKKGVEAYRRRNPGSKLKTAVTGKVKKGSKDAKRRKSYCARSAGQMKKFPKAAKDPNSRLRQARRRWKC